MGRDTDRQRRGSRDKKIRVGSEIWMDEPEEHDYAAAFSYLQLLFEKKRAEAIVKALRKAPLLRQKAKDLLRASGLPILADTNPHVARDLKKVRKGKSLSPVLLVRGDADHGLPLIVADGYHRICASWHVDEDAAIPCRMIDRPA